MDRKRTFTDRTGTRWKVSEIAPTQGAAPLRERRKFPRSPRPGVDPNSFATREPDLAWLRFECSSDLRRLNAVPADWEELTDAALEDLLVDSVRLKA